MKFTKKDYPIDFDLNSIVVRKNGVFERRWIHSRNDSSKGFRKTIKNVKLTKLVKMYNRMYGKENFV